MPATPDMIDFFVSRRGAAREIAMEVAGVLQDAGYTVRVQDYDIAVAGNFIAAIHRMLTECRHMIAILTRDYIESPYTKEEWTNFLATSKESDEERRLIPLRVENFKPTGLFAAKNYADLVGITNPAARRDIILDAAVGQRTPLKRPPRAFHGVPPQITGFVGREDLLDHLHRTLAANRPMAITQAAIHGLGGIGKTSLAAEYAHRHFDQYAGVWWASAESRTVLIESLAELGAVLNARPNEASQSSDPAKAAADMARAALVKLGESPKPWLLIYDNVDKPAHIRDLIPSNGARILITTRWTNWYGRAEQLEVNLMSEAEAVDLLLKITSRKDREGARRLANALGRLPLALDHAGAYIADTGMSFDRYTQRAVELIARAPEGTSYPHSVCATFSLAIEKVVGECAAADTLLAFLSMLSPEQIPRDLIDATILAEDTRDDALAALHRFSLLDYGAEQREGSGETIFVHRLVRAAVHRRLEESGRKADAVRVAIARTAKAYPDKGLTDPTCWPRCKELLPHALAVRDEAHEARIETVELAELLDGAANYLLGRGSFSDAEPLFLETISIARRHLGKEHGKVGEWLNNLGNLYLNSARYKEAAARYREAISIGIKTLGRDAPGVATRVNNLAKVLMRLGRLRQAEGYFLDAIHASVKTYGRKHFVVATRRINLANLLRESGRYAEAEPIYREAISVGEKAVGRDHYLVCMWRKELANLLRDTGRYRLAESLYRRTLATLAKAVGEQHSSVAFTREDLSELLLLTGHLDEAEQEARLALASHVECFSPRHHFTQGAAKVLIEVLVKKKRLEEASALRTRHGIAKQPRSRAPRPGGRGGR